MIRHVAKLVWNRKRENSLLVLEIFIAFLVLFSVVLLGAYAWDGWRAPLGFQVQDVWAVDLRAPGDREANTAEAHEQLRQLLAAAQQLPEVEAACAAAVVPYGDSTMASISEVDGKAIRYEFDEASDGCAAVLRLDVVEGRFFSKEDDGALAAPVVITREFARRAFGGGSALGKELGEGKERQRIVGVLRDYRKAGELALPRPFLISRRRLEDDKARLPGHLVLRVRPGTSAAFEEPLIRTLRRVAPGWQFESHLLPDLRVTKLRQSFTSMAAFGVVAVFLLLMVGLGLTGVLWQTITRRTPEMGLRRAQGATRRDILVQILAEIAVLTTLGVGAGVLVVAQIPLLSVLDVFRPGVFALALAGSVAAMYALTALCGVVPGRLAAAVHPVVALRHE